MKALTVCQPYAELIARGDKPIENRTWSTPYRGRLMIHAGKSRDWLGDSAGYRLDPSTFAMGAVVATAEVVACLNIRAPWPMAYADLQIHEHANGPWCWILEDVQRLRRPVFCQGAQGLWLPFADVLQAVREAANG